MIQDKKKWDFSSCQLSHKPRCSGPRKGWGMPTVWSLVYGPPLSGINTTQYTHPLAPGQQSSFHPPSFAEVGQPATILISQIPSQVEALGQREIGKETCKNEGPKRPSKNKLGGGRFSANPHSLRYLFWRGWGAGHGDCPSRRPQSLPTGL